MKKLKQILSGSLLLVLLLSVFFPARATEESGIALNMMASEPVTQVGESVLLTIRTEQDFVTRGSGMTIYYDDEKLELDLKNSSTTAPFAIHGPMKVNGRNAFRISFLPQKEKITVSASDPLAVVSFKALSVTEQTTFFMEASYLYDDNLTQIALTRPEKVSVAIEPAAVLIPVTGIVLDKTELTIEEGDLAALKASVAPASASNPAVVWTSSNENVAKVSSGVIKAIREGTATVTATTIDGGYTASCLVTVTPPFAGYTAKMPADMMAVIGETIQIPIVISNEDGKTGYNAFDLNVTYDTTVLELVSTELPDVKITASNGQINMLGYGEGRRASTIPVNLEFKALKLQRTEVVLNDARVDNSGNAIAKNTSKAIKLDDRTIITITGYPVTLPEGFTGEATAAPNTDYTFAIPKDYYDYEVKASVDGKEVQLTDNGDGSYTVGAEQVSGEIVITATKTGKTFQVTLPADMKGETTAQHGTDYVATLNWDGSYRFSVMVTIGGKEYTGYTAAGTTYTIPGGDITGEIVFTINKTTITPITPPTPTEPAVPTTPTTSTTPTTPNATIPTTPTTQNAAQSADTGLPVAVHSYVTLDNTQIFLITVQGDPGEGMIYAYGKDPMYYSEKYDCWVILVMMKGELSIERAQKSVSVMPGEQVVLEKTLYDVDKNGRTEVKDAQLVYDLYNAGYQLTDKDAKTFLYADVNMDKKLDIMDVVAVLHGILQG